MDKRLESDSIGTLEVPENAYYGVQTLRGYNNFRITGSPADHNFILNIVKIKKAAALVNEEVGSLDKERSQAIVKACDEVLDGALKDEFITDAIQGGAGTTFNMNVNEVVANRGNEIAGKKLLHPNDDVNKSQSSNDTFPTAMHIAAVVEIEDKLLPAMDKIIATFRRLEKENEGVVKSGRTHLQDAVPIGFSQEISGWRSMIEKNKEEISYSIHGLK